MNKTYLVYCDCRRARTMEQLHDGFYIASCTCGSSGLILFKKYKTSKSKTNILKFSSEKKLFKNP